MPILRLNAGPDGLTLHRSPAAVWPAIGNAAVGQGPVIVMIHGFKYDPDSVRHSPHSTIFGLDTARANVAPWLRPLGFGTGNRDEGLAIAFAWRARGNLWRAAQAARKAGKHLADVIAWMRARAPGRPVHIISQSMGSEVVFEALSRLPPCSV
ncbi:MAG: alpha/beta hydrolase, partial [Pseudomonadota bacterium]